MKTPAKRRTGEVTASNVSTEQTWCTGESPYTGESITSESAYRIQTFNTTNWYTGESAYTGESITINRRIRFQRSTNRLAHRRISVHRRIDYHYSAYQIPTFNTTNWYTGELAYTGESITIHRRIRFQRSTQQIGTPANWRTQANRLPSFGVSDSNVQHNRLVYRRIGVHRRIDYHHSAYQIPTSNTTDWYTGESAYRRPATGDRRPASRRIRFQRSTQQIGTPAKRRTGDRRVAVSDSNVQHNRLVHRRSGVPATGESPYQIPTFNTTDWYTGEAAYRRPAIGDRRTGDRRPATGDRRPASRRINFQRKRR